MVEIDPFKFFSRNNNFAYMHELIYASIQAELERLKKLKQERMETKVRNKEDMKNFLKKK